MNEYDETKKILRIINESRLVEEEENDGIPITDDAKFGNNVLSQQKEEAKKNIGADFRNYKTPLIYYKNDGDVVFSGEIPDMNNLKFQFRYRDSSGLGCYIWVDGLQMTDENLKKINRIQGFYKNWKDSITKNSAFQ